MHKIKPGDTCQAPEKLVRLNVENDIFWVFYCNLLSHDAAGIELGFKMFDITELKKQQWLYKRIIIVLGIIAESRVKNNG